MREKSVEFYTMAAEQGLAEAQLSLAVHYYAGKGVETDLKWAFKLTKKAAKLGLMDAEFRLALMLNMGIGVNRKPEKAVIWFQIAAAKEHERENFIIFYENFLHEGFSGTNGWLVLSVGLPASS